MRSYLAPQSCTVMTHTKGDFCDAPSADDMPFPICANHALMLFRRMRKLVDEALPDRPTQMYFHTKALLSEREEKDAQHKKQGCFVYYLEVKPYIKIGSARNLPQRLRQYPPYSKLLAKELGDYELEIQRHRQFKHLLAHGKEWFHPGPDLLAFVEKVKLGRA